MMNPIVLAAGVLLPVLALLPDRRTGRSAASLLGELVGNSLLHLACFLVALLDVLEHLVNGAPVFFVRCYRARRAHGFGPLSL